MSEENLLKMAEQKFQSAAEKIAKDLIATCYKEPQTNADRIRAMSDEELAELLYGFCWNGEHCYSCPLYNKDCGGINGLEAWKKWIKQPAEE